METRFNESRAQAAVDFFSNRLSHTKGRWAGSPFILEPWQADDIIRPLFGEEYYAVEQERWLRRYRKALIELPKKNGKSELGSGLALQGLHADGEPGPEVFSVATNKRQAALVFNVAADMTDLNSGLRKRSEVNRSKIATHGVIYIAKTRGVYKVIPGDEAGDDGINPSRVILDELHRFKRRDIYDLIDDSFSARTEPLFVILTTAGVQDETSVAWELHEYARQVADGTIQDPHLFVYMRGATRDEVEGDKWLDEDLWRRVNPAVSFNPGLLEDLRRSAAEARHSPAKRVTFKRLRLNVWLPASAASSDKLVDLAVWDRSAGLRASLEGRDVAVAVDMAATTDMTAAVAGAWNQPGECRNCRQTTKPCLDVEARFWMPAETLAGGRPGWSKDMLNQLRLWVEEGWLQVVDGAVIDDSDVKAGIHAWAEHSDVSTIAVDPWQARQLRIDLEDEGFTIFEHPQTMRAMSPPTRELVDLIVDGRFHHAGNPILRWMADNTVGQTDTDGNLKPSRRKSSGKIDGIVASVMLITAATLPEETQFGISLI